MPAAPRKTPLLSATLKLIRSRRGLRAVDVARKMGMPLRTYQHFEAGKTHLDIARIAAFAAATDSDPHSILAAVMIGSPAFAVRTMDNKFASVLVAGLQRFDERLGDRLAHIEVARLITAARRMFDELEVETLDLERLKDAWLLGEPAPEADDESADTECGSKD